MAENTGPHREFIYGPLAKCQNPTCEQVRGWFHEAGKTSRFVRNWETPSDEVCERTAHMLAAMPMLLEDWRKLGPGGWKPDRANTGWHRAARWAWVASTWAWHDAGRRPHRLNDESPTVLFVSLALSHFGASYFTKYAIAKVLKKAKEQIDGRSNDISGRLQPGVLGLRFVVEQIPDAIFTKKRIR